MLGFSGLALRRSATLLFEDVDLNIYPGQKIGITGANGCGKSSLFALLRGELSADQGDFSLPADWAVASVAQETRLSDRIAVEYVIDGDEELRAVEARLRTAEQQADADQIEQVMLNLLSNAADAMPRGGTVHVNLGRSPDGGARLLVADEGHGIPEEIQARIFDPFFSTKEIGKGTGLGLAISYGIVQDHGGDIVVQSTPGHGATFIVTLPASGKPDGSSPPS